MKILIVDDEKLTREGIISNIDWEKLGIDTIYEGDDGINGLEVARLNKPDIILSDVRMPRMNGIEMAKELHKTLPFASIIFMSGYSDKEYLKEAIKLKVISYVEKPIDALEIEASIKNALEEQVLHVKNQIKDDYHIKYSQNKLGLKIIYPATKDIYSDYTKEFNELGYQIKGSSEFTTVIITLKTAISNITEHQTNELYFNIDEIVKRFHMNYILSIKNDEFLILHLFTNHKGLATTARNICHLLSISLNKSYQYYIAVGKTVCGLKNVYESYNGAVILLQSSFFNEYNSVIVSDNSSAPSSAFDQSLFSSYTQALNQQNQEEVISTVTTIFNSYKNNQHVLPNYAKDLYYKLFSFLIHTASTLHISNFFEEDSSALLGYISKDKNLFELNELLLDKINLLFSALGEHTKENTTIYTIKDFIGKNYKNDSLSVKDISEHVYLSSSYVCTLFKNETGKTLNQYITEFRIEKAKNMLKDSRYKISDISAKVGYSDGNYFGKTFKKLVDLSPSEYRERSFK